MNDALDRADEARTTLDPYAIAALRVVTGLVIAAHGWQKVTGFDGWVGQVGALGIPVPEVMAVLAIIAELGGGILLALGWLTPVAAVLILVNMTVAILVVHRPRGLFAANGGFEYPLILAMIAIYFFAHGPGPQSVDAMLQRRSVLGRPARLGRPGEGAPTSA